ncbi:MAG: hypothetical protein VB997_03930, partial [Opitutales bacterium]
ETNRGTKGVKLVDLAKGDKLVAISRVVMMQEGEEEGESEQLNVDAPDESLLSVEESEIAEGVPEDSQGSEDSGEASEVKSAEPAEGTEDEEVEDAAGDQAKPEKDDS